MHRVNFCQDDDVARKLIKEANYIEQILEKEFLSQVGVFCAGKKRSELEIAMEGARIAQGNKSRGGKLYEDIVNRAIRCVSQLPIVQGWKIPGFKHKPLDAFIQSPRILFFITMKRSVRERLDNWNQQGPHCAKYAAQMKLEHRFFAFTHDDKVEAARGKIVDGVTVISTRNQDQIRRVLSEIRDATVFTLT